jgi:uncharacterized protein YfaS (alpha-2-macroglobulin family)
LYVLFVCNTLAQVIVTPNKSEYMAGETAELLIHSSVAPAEAFLFVGCEGVVHHERFRMEDKTCTRHEYGVFIFFDIPLP